MSTGLDCQFRKTDGKWFYELEQEYGHKTDPEYDTYGPFPTFGVAIKHLDDNHANPGGWSVSGDDDGEVDAYYESLGD